MNTFLQIIKAADLASTTEPSSLASPHSPYSASPALSTTVDSSTQENQVKKKQILKRVNIQDIQDMKVCKFFIYFLRGVGEKIFSDINLFSDMTRFICLILIF